MELKWINLYNKAWLNIYSNKIRQQQEKEKLQNEKIQNAPWSDAICQFSALAKSILLFIIIVAMDLKNNFFRENGKVIGRLMKHIFLPWKIHLLIDKIMNLSPTKKKITICNKCEFTCCKKTLLTETEIVLPQKVILEAIINYVT